MADLGRQLRQIVDEAGAGAVPLPVADVISRAGRRRRRRLAGAVVAGTGVACVIAAAALTGASALTPATRQLQAGRAGDYTATATAAGPDGQITVWVRYLPASGGKVAVSQVRATFHYASGYTNPYFGFAFRAAGTGKVDDSFDSRVQWRNSATSSDTGWIAPPGGSGQTTFAVGETLTVVLRVQSVADSPGKIFTVNEVGLVLTPRLHLAPTVGSG